jgi:hypothetical protein
VWQDDRSSTSTPTVFDIYGQRVSSTGDLLDGNFAISTGQDQQQYPAVAYNTNADQYLVMWQDYRNSSTVTPTPISWDIYGQVISSTGELIDPAGTPGPSDPSKNFLIAGEVGAQCYPDVSYSSNTKEYLIVWQEDGDTASRIYGRRLQGSRPRVQIGPPFPIPTYAPNDQKSLAIAYDSCLDEYLVVWQECSTRAGTGWDIYEQRIRGNYPPYIGASRAISNVTGAQISPSVAYNSTAREYLVVWQDARDNPNYSIYGQTVSETGDPLGSNLLISAPTGWNWYPSVAYSSSANEYLVVWQCYTTESCKWAIYGQWISREGELKGGNFRISIQSNNQTLSDVGYSNSANSYLVVWSHEGSIHEGDIYGQLVGPDPTPTMMPTRVPPYVEFNKECYYTTSETATITVVDPSYDGDTINVEVISNVSNDTCIVFIPLREEEANSGVFTCAANGTCLRFSTSICDDDGNTIKVANGVTITAIYYARGRTDTATWYAVAPTPTPACIAITATTTPTATP